jgi:hypothetical protein
MKKKWPYKTGGLLKEVEFIWNLLWQEKKKVTFIYMDVVEGAGRKAKRMVLQCINGVGSNPVEGRTKIWQL